jgi:hypothetical protein
VKPEDGKTIGLLLVSFVFPIEFLAATLRVPVAHARQAAPRRHRSVSSRRRGSVFRTGGSREAVEGDLSDQLSRLGDEAGVRHTL